MTTVNLKYRRPDGATTAGVLLTASDGAVAISSVRRYDTTGGEMTRAAFLAVLGSSVFMDAGTWRFELISVADGRGDVLRGEDAVAYRVVPESGAFDVDDLAEVNPSGSDIVAREFTTTVGDAIHSTFTVAHPLASTDIRIEVYSIATGQTVWPVVQRVGSNTVYVDFGATIPAINSYRVLLQKVG